MRKTYDAVKMMRVIRQALSRRYAGNAALEEKDLEKVRRKYGFRMAEGKSKRHAATEIGEHAPV